MNVTPILDVLNVQFNMDKRKFLAIILLFAPSFAWLYILNIEIFQFSEMVGTHASQDFMWIFTGKILFLASIVVSALIGSVVSERLNNKRLFGAWIFSGVITTIAFAFVYDVQFFLLLSILSGVSFGIGFPSCLAFIADHTTVENRGRVSGITMFSAYILIILFLPLTLQLDIIQVIMLTACFRAISFVALMLDPCEPAPEKKTKWTRILKTRGFSFYFISWVLFIAANGISYFIEPIPNTEPLAALGVVFTYVGVAGIGLISGFVSDRYGRKKTIIFGISTLGISFATLSFFAEPIIWLITQLFYGVAWGVVFVNYYLTVIGDFSQKGSREKIYAIGGVIPLILNMTFELLSQILNVSTSASQISSAVTILLFVCVVPLFFAPETLPEKIVRRKDVIEHIKAAKEIIDKKNTKKQ